MAQYGNYNQSGYGQNNQYGQQAGNPYAQSGGNAYSQNQAGNPYAQQTSNPYAQQGGNPYAQQQQGSQGRQPANNYGQPGSNPYAQQNSQPGAGYGNENIEMGQMNGGGPKPNDPFAILNELRDLDRAIDTNQKNIQRMEVLQRQSLDDTDSSANTPTNRQLDQLGAQTSQAYRNFVQRLNKIKATAGAGDEQNKSQITRVDAKLRDAMQKYQKFQQDSRSQIREQVKRRVLVTRPGATNEELEEACENPNNQVFAQTLLNSTRRGEAQSTLREVQSRSEALRKIERGIIEISELTQQINQLVIEHEPKTQQIEAKSHQVRDDTERGVGELNGAVVKARAARKKKWICLGIVVAILIIVAIALAIVFTRH